MIVLTHTVYFWLLLQILLKTGFVVQGHICSVLTDLNVYSSSVSVKLVIRWADVTQLEKNATLLLPDMVRVSTRCSEHVFSVFLNINETFKLMEQLANIAMRQLLDNKGFEQDRSLPKLKKKTPKKVSALKRSVTATLVKIK